MDMKHIFTAASEVASLQTKVKELECYETDEWAINVLLNKELLTKHVLDPCCGPGVLTYAARRKGYSVTASDVFPWGCKRSRLHDFLNDDIDNLWTFSGAHTTILINPPFSKATDFVKKAHEMGVRKIVCFQAFSWWTSETRNEFWDQYPCARIYVCGSRATCWKFGTPQAKKDSSSTPTTHAWFVWEQGQNTHMPSLGRIYKREAA